jgi:hypothetical protein
MRRIILLAALSLVLKAVTAQDYTTAVGLKFYPGSISIKHFTEKNKAIEGLAYFWNYGNRFTGLYEIHGDINEVDRLRWYIGPGAHIGFWNDTWKTNYPARATGVAIGLDGVLGLDYKLKEAPINISIDWQPSFNLIGYSYFESGWGGLGIRYTF